MSGRRKLTKGNRSDVAPLLGKVVRIVCNHLSAAGLQIYLFGSWAEGRALAESDLDIALDAGKPIGSTILLRIIDDLDEMLTLCKVDIVDLQASDQEFRNRVLRHGELIHGR